MRFSAYPNDHPPPHVHAFTAEIVAILELRADRSVVLAPREDAVEPRNAKRSDVAKVLRLAREHFDELVELWEVNRG